MRAPLSLLYPWRGRPRAEATPWHRDNASPRTPRHPTLPRRRHNTHVRPPDLARIKGETRVACARAHVPSTQAQRSACFASVKSTPYAKSARARTPRIRNGGVPRPRGELSSCISRPGSSNLLLHAANHAFDELEGLLLIQSSVFVGVVAVEETADDVHDGHNARVRITLPRGLERRLQLRPLDPSVVVCVELLEERQRRLGQQELREEKGGILELPKPQGPVSADVALGEQLLDPFREVRFRRHCLAPTLDGTLRKVHELV
mmetsp:Transcript_2296/g.6403  ORF Transcript_2296/g.6403 Transcript_2296/m.6403 type:complete len:262 (+) Transcript_2296:1-786(+)